MSEPAPTTATHARRRLRDRIADRLQGAGERLRGTPRREAAPPGMTMESATALIRDANRAADTFIRGLEADLRALVRRENLGGRLTPELQTRIQGRTPLTLQETNQVLRVLQSEESVQRFIVDRLGRLSGETLASTVTGLSLRREIINPNLLDAAFVVQTRTSFINDLVALAGPQAGPRLRQELEAALSSASAEGRIDLRRIIFGSPAEGGRAAVQGIVTQSLPEMERELESIRRSFRTGGRNITSYVDAVDTILTQYERSLPDATRPLFNRAETIANLRRDLTELAAVRGSLQAGEVEAFITRDLNPVLQRLRNPAASTIEAFLERNLASVTLLEVAPAVMRSATSASEALTVVRNTARWRGVIGRAASSVGRGFAAGWRYVFGTQLRPGQVEAALARGEEIELGLVRRRPVGAVITLALLAGLGYYLYREHVVIPTRIERAEAARVHLDVRASEVYATLGAITQPQQAGTLAQANRAFLLDPANRFIALFVVNDDTFRELALRNPQVLNSELQELRAQVGRNAQLRELIDRQGRQIDAQRQREAPASALFTYQTEMRLRIMRTDVDATPIVQRTALSAENRQFLDQNPDVWYLYNLVAREAINVEPASRSRFTARFVDTGIDAFRAHLQGMTTRDRAAALRLVRQELERRTTPESRAESAPTIGQLMQLFGISAARRPEAQAGEQTALTLTEAQRSDATAFYQSTAGTGIANRLDALIMRMYGMRREGARGQEREGDILASVFREPVSVDGRPSPPEDLRQMVREEVYRILIAEPGTPDAGDRVRWGITSTGSGASMAVVVEWRRAEDQIMSRIRQRAIERRRAERQAESR